MALTRFVRNVEDLSDGRGGYAAGLSATALAMLLSLCAQVGAQSAPERIVLIAPELSANQVGELVRGLANLGIRAVPVQDAQAQLDPTVAACRTLTCVGEAARATGGRAAFASLSRSGDRGESLLWVLVAADGGTAQARARVVAGDLVRAVTSAWNETSLELVLGSDSLIRLETVPVGAMVWLDGVRLGTTPFAQRVAAGEHRLITKLDGFVAQERVVSAHPGRAVQVQMRMARSPSFVQVSEPAAQARSAWNYILGGTLALIALPALITSVNTLANDGQCLTFRGTAASSCSERARFRTRSALELTFGVVAFSTGASLFVAQPLAADVAPPLRSGEHFQLGPGQR